MRLTLRTLLAYLDDVLKPAEAKDIGEKVAESSVARTLVKRIKEVTKRRRLSAPALNGTGMGLEPNTVAEYLDGLLPGEAITQVEKVCLDSDLHLAEVAACHQILALAIGEPVEIPPSFKERAYGLGPSVPQVRVPAPIPTKLENSDELTANAIQSVLEQAPTYSKPKPVVPFSDPQPVDSHPTPSRPVPVLRPVPVPASFEESLPEMLRDRPRIGVKKGLVYLVIALCFVGWGYLTFIASPFGDGRGRPSTSSGDHAQNDNSKHDSDEGDPAVDDAEEVVAHNDTETVASRTKTTTTATDDAMGDALESDPPPYRKSEKVNAGSPRENQAASKNAIKKTTPPLPGDAGDDNPKNGISDAIPPAPPQPVAKFASTDGVAVQFRSQDEAWFVAPPDVDMMPGGDFASPNPFEATVLFPSAQLTLLPGSAVSWLGSSAPFPPGFQLRTGRVRLRASTPANGKASGEALVMSIKLGDAIWRFDLSPEAVCGIEVIPPQPTRLEQPVSARGGLIVIHVANGRVRLLVNDPDEFSLEMAGPASFEVPSVLPRNDSDKNLVDMTWHNPEWMASGKSPVSKSISQQFSRRFSADDSVEITLDGVASDPNARISELATECLGLIGDTAKLVAILQTSKHEESRQVAISSLRTLLLADPSHREIVARELQRRYRANEVEKVYRLLWGFSVQDAQDKSTSTKLVEYLAASDDSIRVLAIHQIKALIGKDFGFHAKATDLQRTSAIKQIKSHLSNNGGCLIRPSNETTEDDGGTKSK